MSFAAASSGGQAELAAANLWWLLLLYGAVLFALVLLLVLAVCWAIDSYRRHRRPDMKESAPPVCYELKGPTMAAYDEMIYQGADPSPASDRDLWNTPPGWTTEQIDSFEAGVEWERARITETLAHSLSIIEILTIHGEWTRTVSLFKWKPDDEWKRVQELREQARQVLRAYPLAVEAAMTSRQVGCRACRVMGPLLTGPGTSGRSWLCECGTEWVTGHV